MLSVASRCILHGINTCLHFWLADFMRNVIHEQNQLKITIYYTIICFAGPVGGMIANAVLKPIIHSYESRKASWPLVLLQITASIFNSKFIRYFHWIYENNINNYISHYLLLNI